jgi:hypothetical protein
MVVWLRTERAAILVGGWIAVFQAPNFAAVCADVKVVGTACVLMACQAPRTFEGHNHSLNPPAVVHVWTQRVQLGQKAMPEIINHIALSMSGSRWELSSC